MCRRERKGSFGNLLGVSCEYPYTTRVCLRLVVFEHLHEDIYARMFVRIRAHVRVCACTDASTYLHVHVRI